MELRHLRYFCAVADKLSFTKAAEELRVAQPALTRQIHALEEELGVKLLNRSKNRVALTEQGRTFLIDAKHLLELAAQSVRAVQRLDRGETGQLNIAYLSKFNFELLPRTLQVFGAEYPQIRLNLFDMTPAEQFRSLQAHKIDLGFVGLRFSTAKKILQWECVARHEAVVVLAEKHPLAKNREINLAELKKLFFVGISERTQPGFQEWLCEICRHVGFTPRVLEDAESEVGLLSFVAEGLGVALARDQIKKLPHAGVVFRPLTPAVSTDYWVAWNRDNESTALLKYVQTVKGLAATQIRT